MRLTPAEESTLRWFAHESEADVGLRSSLGISLERARAGQLFDLGHVNPPEPERYLAAARKFRSIRDRLRRMGPQSHAVLLAAYTTDPFGALRAAGRLGSVAALTEAAKVAHGRNMGTTGRARTSTVARWLAARWVGNEGLRAEVLEEADELLTGAVVKWRAQRPSPRC